MLVRVHDPVQLLSHKFRNIAELSAEELDALAAVPIRVVSMAADQSIVIQDDPDPQSFVLIQGLACSFKVNGDGSRQIVAFHLPGDMPDLLSLGFGRADATIATMTACTIGLIRNDHLRELFAKGLAVALWHVLAADAAITREWVVNLGARNSLSRTAHLLSELFARMQAIGAVKGDSFELPITQQELGDALGISVVHVNRSLKTLRMQGLISWVGVKVSILDRVALAEVGSFVGDYLHFAREKPNALPVRK